MPKPTLNFLFFSHVAIWFLVLLYSSDTRVKLTPANSLLTQRESFKNKQTKVGKRGEGSERQKVRGTKEGAKGKGERKSYKQKKQKYKAHESRHQSIPLGVSLTLCRLKVIGLEAKFKQVNTLMNTG